MTDGERQPTMAPTPMRVGTGQAGMRAAGAGATFRLPPEVLILPGVDEPLLAAPASLALAWKLLWLATDMYPQGKDLYGAFLLGEHTAVDQALVRQLMPRELEGM
uniref:hypothetical protein n=1 Tax=Micromonospora acroterricola TaxID=2202421 RepID=UPI001F46C1E3|nr:hypothetical protein [Micromonospora acroterricola]